jgi:branched-chain amino acid transport system substrate-binding protein
MDAVPIGRDVVLGGRMAAQDINGAGGINGHALDIPFGVDAFREDGKMPGTTDLINQGVVGIAGGSNSALTLLALPVASAAGIPLVAYNATSPSLSTAPGAGDLLWRVVPSDAFQAVVLAHLVSRAGLHQVAVIYEGGVYGQGLSDQFKASFEAQGGLVDPLVPTPAGYGGSYDPYIDQVLAKGTPAGLVILSGDSHAINMLLELQRRNLPTKPAFFGPDGCYTPTFLSNAPSTWVEGMVGSSYTAPTDDLNYQAFVARYVPLAGHGIQPDAVGCYDSVFVQALAMLEGGTNTSQAIRQNLRTVSQPHGTNPVRITPGEWAKAVAAKAAGQPFYYVGVGGRLEFDPHGDVTSGTYLVWTIHNGAYETREVMKVP